MPIAFLTRQRSRRFAGAFPCSGLRQSIPRPSVAQSCGEQAIYIGSAT